MMYSSPTIPGQHDVVTALLATAVLCSFTEPIRLCLIVYRDYRPARAN